MREWRGGFALRVTIPNAANDQPRGLDEPKTKWSASRNIITKGASATMLGRVKRWLLAMLAREERAARGSGAAAKKRRF